MGRKRRVRPQAAPPAAPGGDRPEPAPRALLAAPLACALIAGLSYGLTLAPTIVGGDSAELVTVAAVGGVAHPPGYPLYSLLGGLLARFPAGPVAWRVNLFSAVCAAIAAGLLCRAAGRVAGSAAAGALGAMAFALSPVVWPYAVTAEVFALNNALVAGLLVASTAGGPRRLAVAGLLGGLALSNHHTSVFVAAPVLCWMLARSRPWRSVNALALLGGLATGLLPYGSLPIASAADPPIAWGDLTTLPGFVDHVLRREYGTFRLATEDVGAPGGQLVQRVGLFLGRWARTTAGVGPVTALAGLVVAVRARTVAVAWSGALVLDLVVFGTLSNVRLDVPLHLTVQERFWQQPLLLGSALGALGAADLARRLGRPGEPLLAAGALAVAAVMAFVHLPGMRARRHTLFADYGRAVLEALPERALLLATSDEAIGAVRYLQLVEGVRPDVQIAPTGQLTRPWFRPFAARRLRGVALPAAEGFTAREFLDLNLPRARVFLLNKVPWLATLEDAYTARPSGLVDEVRRRDAPPDIEAWAALARAQIAGFDVERAAAFPAGTWERYVAENVWRQYGRLAAALPAEAARFPGPAADGAVAALLEEIVRRHPAPDPAVFKNLGVAYQRRALAGDAEAASRMAAHWSRYLEAAPPDDPDLPAIRALIARSR